MKSKAKAECYEILKLPFGASQTEIRQAFDLAVQKYRLSNNQLSLRGEDQRCLERALKAYRVLNRNKKDSVNLEFLKVTSGNRPNPYSDKKLSLIKGLNLKEKSQGNTPLIGMKGPSEKIDDRVVVFSDPDSPLSEQYRVLYSRFRQLYGDDKKKIIAISSSVKGEGKTTTCLNLGTVIAKDFSKKVLIIEGDLKQPNFHTYLDSPIQKGLIDILLGKKSFSECIYSFLFENLFLLPTVTKQVNSSNLLSLPKMEEMLSQAAKEFDYIIIDAPPVLPLADMNIISGLVDGIIFVIRAGKTPRDLVKKAMESLPSGKILAIIINGVDTHSGKYYGYPY